MMQSLGSGSPIKYLDEKYVEMNGNTLLYRQINPHLIINGRVGSRAFRPSHKPRHLSVYNGDQITARGAWLHYTSTFQHESIGVMAVIVDECERVG